MEESTGEELIRRYIAAYNAFNVSDMLALLSPDVRFENYSGNKLTAAANGIEEFRQLAEQSKLLFSEREQRITTLDAGKGSTTVGIAYRGRLAADIPGGPPAGTIIELQGTSEFSFRDGEITKIIDRS